MTRAVGIMAPGPAPLPLGKSLFEQSEDLAKPPGRTTAQAGGGESRGRLSPLRSGPPGSLLPPGSLARASPHPCTPGSPLRVLTPARAPQPRLVPPLYPPHSLSPSPLPEGAGLEGWSSQPHPPSSFSGSSLAGHGKCWAIPVTVRPPAGSGFCHLLHCLLTERGLWPANPATTMLVSWGGPFSS